MCCRILWLESSTTNPSLSHSCPHDLDVDGTWRFTQFYIEIASVLQPMICKTHNIMSMRGDMYTQSYDLFTVSNLLPLYQGCCESPCYIMILVYLQCTTACWFQHVANMLCLFWMVSVVGFHNLSRPARWYRNFNLASIKTFFSRSEHQFIS